MIAAGRVNACHALRLPASSVNHLCRGPPKISLALRYHSRRSPSPWVFLTAQWDDDPALRLIYFHCTDLLEVSIGCATSHSQLSRGVALVQLVVEEHCQCAYSGLQQVWREAFVSNGGRVIRCAHLIKGVNPAVSPETLVTMCNGSV